MFMWVSWVNPEYVLKYLHIMFWRIILEPAPPRDYDTTAE